MASSVRKVPLSANLNGGGKVLVSTGPGQRDNPGKSPTAHMQLSGIQHDANSPGSPGPGQGNLKIGNENAYPVPGTKSTVATTASPGSPGPGQCVNLVKQPTAKVPPIPASRINKVIDTTGPPGPGQHDTPSKPLNDKLAGVMLSSLNDQKPKSPLEILRALQGLNPSRTSAPGQCTAINAVTASKGAPLLMPAVAGPGQDTDRNQASGRNEEALCRAAGTPSLGRNQCAKGL
jgi:hypothetical protein